MYIQQYKLMETHNVKLNITEIHSNVQLFIKKSSCNKKNSD